jgi:hypothetical protein
MSDCDFDMLKLAIGLSLLVLLFMGSTIYFAYWANRLRDILLREWDEQESKQE